MGEIAINPIHNVHKKYRKMNLVNPYVFESIYDADAQSFITAATITDNTQKEAINQLVLDLKSNSIWTKLQAIYPFVGGTSTTHKWNLKDARDLDEAFRLTYGGTITHNSNGVTFGTTSQCSTHYLPATYSVINNFQYSYYCRNEISGAYLFFLSGSMQLFANISNLLLSDMYNTSSTPRVTAPNTSSIGFFAASRILTGTAHSIYKNGDLKATNGVTGGILNSTPIFINNQAGTQGSNCAFATLGEGLTDSENTNLYTIIQAFQTTLGRQI